MLSEHGLPPNVGEQAADEQAADRVQNKLAGEYGTDGASVTGDLISRPRDVLRDSDG